MARRNKQEERGVARRRVMGLLAAATLEAAPGAPHPRQDLADRYAALCLRVAERYQAGLPAEAKAQICRSCAAFLVPGRTSRVRLTAGRLTTTCLRCNAVRRQRLGPRTIARPPGGAAGPPVSAPASSAQRSMRAPSKPGPHFRPSRT